jgi:hypothetical protein
MPDAASLRAQLLELAHHVHGLIAKVADMADVPEQLPAQAPAPITGPLPLDEVAPAGVDGVQAARLMQAAKEHGSKVLYYLSQRATKRLLADPNADHFFNADEQSALRNAIAATTSSAELLGRSRIRERARHVLEAQAGASQFAESDVFHAFAEPPPPLPPRRAIEYFQRLVPELNVDPQRFGPLQQRRAFTMAARADQVLLDRVKGLIQTGLESGQPGGMAPRIEHLLDDAGVSPANPQYSDMVFRTNMMDAYTPGAQEELQTPDMQELFPAWQYLGIRDGRQGKDHEPHFSLYFSNEVMFGEVRGERVFNCRCSPRPIDKFEWAKLQDQGKRLEWNW